jgi:hypothetical protein
MKRVYEKLEDIPEAHRGLYELKDGKYVLPLEDVEDVTGLKTSLGSERKAREAFEKEVKELKARFNGIDPEKALEAQKRIQELEDKKMLDAGKVEELLQQKTERMRQDYETKLAALNKDRETTATALAERDKRLADLLIDSAITEAAIAAGVRKSALPDVLLRARTIYGLVEGKPVPKRPDGTVIYGAKDPNQPMPATEWVASLVKDAGHLFETSGGSGGNGSGNRNGANGQTGVMVISREDARDGGKYQAAKERAAKEGKRLEIEALAAS